MKQNNNYKQDDIIQFNKLSYNQTGIILNVSNDNKALKRRLLDMGFTRGTKVQIKRRAPLGDPVNIIIRGYELCIRLSDLKNIYVRVVKE